MELEKRPPSGRQTLSSAQRLTSRVLQGPPSGMAHTWQHWHESNTSPAVQFTASGHCSWLQVSHNIALQQLKAARNQHRETMALFMISIFTAVVLGVTLNEVAIECFRLKSCWYSERRVASFIAAKPLQTPGM